MAKNRLIIKEEKQEIKEQVQTKPKAKPIIKPGKNIINKKPSFFIIFLRKIIDGTFFTTEGFKNLPFIFYIAFLSILFIANTYNSTETLRNIERTKREIKELKYQNIMNKSELASISRQSEIYKKMKDKKFKIPDKAPYKILIKSNTNNNNKKNNIWKILGI
ncbi:MAG: hypothetical protein KA792_06190 [Bacteroidales bacterium]|nr:hypothetical protein [Bacteroidales bacterium]